MDQRSVGRIIFVICILAFVFRFSVSLLVDASAWPDTKAYTRIARSIVSGHGFSQSADIGSAEYRSPLYPIFLATIYKFSGSSNLFVQMIQSLFGAIICWLVYGIGKKLFNNATALLAGAITSVYPILVYISGLLLTEQVFIFFLISAIFFIVKSMPNLSFRCISVSGMCLGLASLTRPASLIFVPFCALYVFLGNNLHWKKRTVFAVAFIGSVFLAISPWTVRNYIKYRELIFISTAGGLNFYLGNNDLSDGSDYNATILLIKKGYPDDLKAALSAAPTAKAKENIYYRYAFSWIKKNPRRFFCLYLKKMLNFWRVTPDHVSDIYKGKFVDVFSALILIPLYILSIMGIWASRHRWQGLLILYFALFSMSFGLSLFITSYRFRIPLDPILILFCSYSVYNFIGPLTKKWAR